MAVRFEAAQVAIGERFDRGRTARYEGSIWDHGAAQDKGAGRH
jgi:hypothetical protein